MTGSSRLLLASASPRRAQILRNVGVAFDVVPSGADEALVSGEEAGAAAERLARAKALAVVPSQTLPVLGADTLVTCEGRILGKPESAAASAEMLRLLSGRTHEVVTGLCLVAQGAARSGVERTAVTVALLDEADIDWYVATGEGLDKAGAYHIDGRFGVFIEAVAGSPSNVAGLPLSLLLRLAREAGVSLGLP
jgi:septum formation protein